MSIKNWPKKDRPRERLIEHGAQHLSDSELLAILLRQGSRQKSALELARDLLKKFGNLRDLLNVDYTNLIKQPGIGPTKYAQLQAAAEISKRYLEPNLKKQNSLENTQDVMQFLLAKLRDYKNEVVACLFLNCQYQMINFEIISTGTLTQSMIHPRQLIKRVLHHNAFAIILAHNHPSGDASPSEMDIKVTQQLKHALALFDIPLLDHFVIGATHVNSCLRR